MELSELETEIANVLQRSHSLVEEGLVTGVRNVSHTALYMAALETLDRMDPPEVIGLVKSGLDDETFKDKPSELVQVALRVLIAQASRLNGNGEAKN